MSAPRKILQRSDAIVGQMFKERDNLIAVAKNLKDLQGANIRLSGYKIIDRDSHINFLNEEAYLYSKYGWKLHINIAYEDYSRAWPLIVPSLVDYNLKSFKAWSYFQADAENLKNSSKQVTIYCVKNSFEMERWEALMRQIEEILIKNNISPGAMSVANKEISGSQFWSYRNDKHPITTSRYIADEEAVQYTKNKPGFEAYNPSRSYDSFKDIKISLSNLDEMMGSLRI